MSTSVPSTSVTGAFILIRGNSFTETLETAMAIKGCEDVRILGNEFASSTPPQQGA